MDNQKQLNSQSKDNIVRQQPINPIETINQNSKQTLDQRIQSIQSQVSQTKKPIQSLFKTACSTFQKSQKPTHSHRQSPNVSVPLPTMLEEPSPNKPTTSQTTNNLNLKSTLPIIQIPKKSTMSFIERFKAHHANHQKPEYYKVATIPCGQNKEKDIPIYRFKNEKRAYEAAEDHGKNQYKCNGRLVSYFPTIGKMPNKTKFSNEFQKQI